MERNQYLVPVSIVFAGIIIAGAVIYIGGGGGTAAPGGGLGDSGGSALPTPIEAARAIGLDESAFRECFEGGRHADAVREDALDAVNAGGTGTPYSVVVAENGMKFPVFGALPITQLRPIIDAALAEDGSVLSQTEHEAGGPVGDMRPVSDDDHLFGNPDAPVKLVEYSDLECPFCSRFHPTVEQVVEEYDGRVAWVYRHLPLDQIHPSAIPLAEGSECAAELGGNDAFWAYIDHVFES